MRKKKSKQFVQSTIDLAHGGLRTDPKWPPKLKGVIELRVTSQRKGVKTEKTKNLLKPETKRTPPRDAQRIREKCSDKQTRPLPAQSRGQRQSHS